MARGFVLREMGICCKASIAARYAFWHEYVERKDKNQQSHIVEYAECRKRVYICNQLSIIRNRECLLRSLQDLGLPGLYFYNFEKQDLLNLSCKEYNKN